MRLGDVIPNGRSGSVPSRAGICYRGFQLNESDDILTRDGFLLLEDFNVFAGGSSIFPPECNADLADFLKGHSSIQIYAV